MYVASKYIQLFASSNKIIGPRSGSAIRVSFAVVNIYARTRNIRVDGLGESVKTCDIAIYTASYDYCDEHLLVARVKNNRAWLLTP